jgi:ATP-dependent Clp protease, protease subunit
MVSYELLSKDRNLNLFGAFTTDSVSKLADSIRQIQEADAILEREFAIIGQEYKRLPITIYIESYGGSVYPTLGLISIIEKSVTPIHTVANGCAMSCGFLLLISGHKRFARKYTTIMCHEIASGTGGKLTEMKDDVKETERLGQILSDITTKKTKITKTKLDEIYKSKTDWFFGSEDALRYGVIDAII